MFSQEVVVDHDSGELIPAVFREITPAVVSEILGARCFPIGFPVKGFPETSNERCSERLSKRVLR